MSAPTIIRLSIAQLAQYAELGWTVCGSSGCDGHAEFLGCWRDPTTGTPKRRRFCAKHAAAFCKRRRLELPMAAPDEPETITAFTNSGRPFSLCPNCRHWLDRPDLLPGECLPGCTCTAPCHAAREVA